MYVDNARHKAAMRHSVESLRVLSDSVAEAHHPEARTLARSLADSAYYLSLICAIDFEELASNPADLTFLEYALGSLRYAARVLEADPHLAHRLSSSASVLEAIHSQIAALRQDEPESPSLVG